MFVDSMGRSFSRPGLDQGIGFSKPHQRRTLGGFARRLHRTHARGQAARAPNPPGPRKADKVNPLDRFYFNLTGFPFPLGPFFGRKTLRYEVREWQNLLHTGFSQWILWSCKPRIVRMSQHCYMALLYRKTTDCLVSTLARI